MVYGAEHSPNEEIGYMVRERISCSRKKSLIYCLSNVCRCNSVVLPIDNKLQKIIKQVYLFIP